MLPLALPGSAAPAQPPGQQAHGTVRPGQVARSVLTTGTCHWRLENHLPTLQFHHIILPSSFLISPSPSLFIDAAGPSVGCGAALRGTPETCHRPPKASHPISGELCSPPAASPGTSPSSFRILAFGPSISLNWGFIPSCLKPCPRKTEMSHHF